MLRLSSVASIVHWGLLGAPWLCSPYLRLAFPPAGSFLQGSMGLIQLDFVSGPFPSSSALTPWCSTNNLPPNTHLSFQFLLNHFL